MLSNTHAFEVRSWPESRLSGLVDAVGFSHEIGALKPEGAAYAAVLERLDVDLQRVRARLDAPPSLF